MQERNLCGRHRFLQMCWLRKRLLRQQNCRVFACFIDILSIEVVFIIIIIYYFFCCQPFCFASTICWHHRPLRLVRNAPLVTSVPHLAKSPSSARQDPTRCGGLHFTVNQHYHQLICCSSNCHWLSTFIFFWIAIIWQLSHQLIFWESKLDGIFRVLYR